MQPLESGCYVIENRVNGHRYIGSSVNVSERLWRHKKSLNSGNHHSQYLQRAWDKYGENSFRFIFLLVCSKSDLLRYEQELIDAWKPEYNILKVAGSVIGYKFSDEVKNRMSKSRKGKVPWNKGLKGFREGVKFSEEHKRKIGLSNSGKHPGEKSRAKMRSAHIGKKFSVETRLKMSASLSGESNPWWGKHHSEESRTKMSKSRKGIPWTINRRIACTRKRDSDDSST